MTLGELLSEQARTRPEVLAIVSLGNFGPSLRANFGVCPGICRQFTKQLLGT